MRITVFLICILIFAFDYKSAGQGIEIDSTQNITNSLGDDLAPTWSSDSQQLLFHSNRDGNWDIFIYSLLTDSLIKVTTGAANERNPVWFNKDRSIVFDAEISGKQRLYKMNMTNGKTESLFDRFIEVREASFPVSEKLVYFSGFDPLEKRWEIYSFDFYYENLNKLTDLEAGNFTPKVSPDEDHVLFINNSGNYPFHQLQMMNWYGNEKKLIAEFNAYDPYWDSNGLKIYFVSGKDDRLGEVYSIWKDGSHLEKMTDCKYPLKNPCVSPDGKYLALSVKLESGYDLFLVPLEDY